MTMIPNKMFFTKGVGKHKEKLHAFELALRNAGIEKCNLVYVSSILPPHCKVITKKEGLKQLKAGQITFCVMAKNETNEPNRLISSSVGVAIPKNKDNYGYLSEHHSFGQKEKESGDYAEDLAATMLGSTLGVDVDPEKDWNERKDSYKVSDQIVKTKSITQTSKGNKGLWTVVLAAAVMLDG